MCIKTYWVIGNFNFYEWKKLKVIYVCSSTFIPEAVDFWNGALSDIKIYVTSSYQGSTFGGRPVEVKEHCGYFSDNFEGICSHYSKQENNKIIFIMILFI